MALWALQSPTLECAFFSKKCRYYCSGTLLSIRFWSILQEFKSNFQTFCYSACLERSNLTKIQKNECPQLGGATVIKHRWVKGRSSENQKPPPPPPPHTHPSLSLMNRYFTTLRILLKIYES
jgi:hypothetical protein